MAGTSTPTITQYGDLIRAEVAFVGDAGDGSIPDCVLPGVNGQVIEVEKIDGTPTPTAGWDATYADADGSTSPYLDRDHPLTVSFTGQTDVSAQGRVVLRISRRIVS